MISVCMATYNGEKYLREQVNSILAQLGTDDELVISDDGSKDSTISILKSYNDTRIKIFHNTKNHGVNGNFENALEHSKGDYIFLSDQDDIWMPDKINTCVKALQMVDCIVHDALIVDSDKNIVSESFFKERNSGSGFWKNLYKNTCIGCCMAFTDEVLKKSLPIPNTTAFFHDNWIGCIADAKFKLEFIPFKGIMFRRHESVNSCTTSKSKYSTFQQFTHRMIQLILIVERLYLRIKK